MHLRSIIFFLLSPGYTYLILCKNINNVPVFSKLSFIDSSTGAVGFFLMYSSKNTESVRYCIILIRLDY